MTVGSRGDRTRSVKLGRPKAGGARPLQSVTRVLDILDYLAAAPDGLTLSDIGRKVALPISTVYRALSTLAGRHLVSFDPDGQRYRIGLGLMRYGLGQSPGVAIQRMVRPFMVELAQRTRETVVLALPENMDRVYVDQIESQQPVRHVQELWRPLPLYLGASGRAILAHLPADQVEEYLARGPFPQLRPNSIAHPEKLRRRIKEIRARGYERAVSERLEGTASVAAPILDERGCAIGALLVCGPDSRKSSIFENAELVRATAEQCSLRCGYIRPAPVRAKHMSVRRMS